MSDEEPKTDLERLRLLEYADSDTDYMQDRHFQACHVCCVIKPSERHLWKRYNTEHVLRDIEKPNGPRHEDNCWLGKRLAEAE